MCSSSSKGSSAKASSSSVDDSELPLDSIEASGAYLAPIAERYSTLDELMLSGE